MSLKSFLKSVFILIKSIILNLKSGIEKTPRRKVEAKTVCFFIIVILLLLFIIKIHPLYGEEEDLFRRTELLSKLHANISYIRGNIESYNDACIRFNHVNYGSLDYITSTISYTIDCFKLDNYLTIQELESLVLKMEEYKLAIMTLKQTVLNPIDLLNQVPEVFNIYDIDNDLKNLLEKHYQDYSWFDSIVCTLYSYIYY